MNVSPEMYQALAIRYALEIYSETGMKVNRAYTPANMIRMATKITGIKFRARDYQGAADALAAWVAARGK